MAPDKASNSQVAFPSIDESIGPLVPLVEDLVQRICGVPVATEVRHEGMVVVDAPLSFPDAIGSGAVRAELFKYRESIRLDVRLVHNRMFALADGTPSDRPCFMNDYVASSTVEMGDDEIPTAFVRQVVAGVAAARDAVRRHNRHAHGPWDEILVAAAE